MLKSVQKGEHKLGAYTYLTAFLAIAYAIWPIDILPDFIPGLGWVDDTAAFFLLYRQLKSELKKYNEMNTPTNAWVMTKK